MRDPGARSTLSRAVVVTLLGLASLLVAGGQPVAAECDGPFPDFRALTRTATRIVIGDVVEIRGGGAFDPLDGGISSRFTLHVRYVVRGDSPAIVDIADLPTQPCASVVGVRRGDRIALALGGLDFQPPKRVNMVAWIDAVPPPGFGPDSLSQAETMSVAEVFALVGMDAPAEQPSSTPAGDPAPDVGERAETSYGLLAALILVSVATLLAIRHVRARRSVT